MSEKRVIILDTSAFISGIDPFSIENKQYSVPQVRQELLKNSLVKLRFDTATTRNMLKVLDPDPFFLDELKSLSIEAGDIRSLSKADIHILALALQLKREGYDPLIVTDDFSIQNMARKIGVNFTPLNTFGIQFFIHWLLYCPACHKKYFHDYKHRQCEICGTTLKRKPLRKSPVK